MSDGGNSGNYYKAGDWLAVCDICGFRFKASKLRKNWKNEMVCEEDFELRHPQEFIRVRPEKIAVPWARPETDIMLFICYIWARSAYADLAEADCAQADFTPLSYAELFAMKFPPIPPNTYIRSSGIPGYAIPGYAIPGVTYTGL
jgi:hypothetical protein